MNFFITGTDTEIGKTIASAWVMLHHDAKYWKPIQSGMDEETDAQVIRELTECCGSDILPSRFELKEPLSPHEAAKRDGVSLDLKDFRLPVVDEDLIVEGAGGVLVPLNDQHFMGDLILHLELPAIVVCRSGLGTINHTLLTLQALQQRAVDVAGVIMVGEKSPHNRQAIEDYGNIAVLGEIPPLAPLNKASLLSVKPEPAFYKIWQET